MRLYSDGWRRSATMAKSPSITSAAIKSRATTSSLEKFSQDHSAEDMLRRSNATLARQLAQTKHRTSELIAAVERAVHDAASGLVLPPVTKPVVSHGEGDEEVALILVSDMQLAKVTATYNSKVAEQRM